MQNRITELIDLVIKAYDNVSTDNKDKALSLLALIEDKLYEIERRNNDK